MKAYKALQPNMTSYYGRCLFELGTNYSVDEEIVMCENGFHACMDVRDVFYYYSWNSRIFEVEIENDIIQRGHKIVGRNCTLLREITDEVKNTEGMALAAVKRDSRSIRFMDNPSEAVQLAAVKQNGYAIQFIKNPSEEVQLTAVKTCCHSIQYIENPTEKVKALVKSLDKS